MKNYIAIFFLGALLVGCDSFQEAKDYTEVKEISVNFDTKTVLEGMDSYEGFTVTFEDVKYNTKQTETLGASGKATFQVIPGVYKIDVTGEYTDEYNDTYILSGSLMNYPLVKDGEKVEVTVNGLRRADLIFKEIYYCGSRTPLNTTYFRDQFYELYNNSEDKVIYLDGIFFANLTPTKATDKLPVWPESDAGRYVYADRIWKFPGGGTDYPLLPGESCVISQFAANHQLPQYNANAPINCASSEFEFNMNNANFPDQPAYDMLHVFVNGQANMTGVQYLTSVFGGAYVIFKPLGDEAYDPVNNPDLKTKDLSSTSTTIYGKVPITYVIDAVEAIDNESMFNAKRMVASLDRGATYVDETYCGLGVARKKIGEHPDGTPLLQDTNNSTDDFDRKVVPQLRRYGAKMPSWNHTLK